MKDYMKICQEWLSNPYFDGDTEAGPRVIEGGENKIRERSYTDLEFGAAGLRGVIGAGINRMGIYAVRHAAQGLANHVMKRGGAGKGMAIACDSRHMSPEFAMETAMTLATNGIRVYKFESLRLALGLSFAVRELGHIAGINITTSHDSSEYSGYKVYWGDDAQFTPSHDKGATEEVLAIEDLSTVKITNEVSAAVAGKYEVIGREIDSKYIAQVEARVVNQKAINEIQDQINIVYTPFHDTEDIPTRRVMRELEFTHVYVVPEQELPDGGFPMVSYPNPEAAEAFSLNLKLVAEKSTDLVLVTDPDAGRSGVYVRDAGSGEYIPLTGNMSGSLLCKRVLNRKKIAGEIPDDGQVIKSIVSTSLIDAVVKEYGCELIEALAGFKWTGQQVLKNGRTDRGTHLSGMRENYGCLIGTYARDRDAVSTTAALCEVAVYYKRKGMTLQDTMVAMYEKYGHYKDAAKSIGLSGIGGLAKIQSIMETSRNNTPKEASGYKVISAKDYKLDTIRDMASEEVEPTGSPSSNVLYYDLSGGVWICVRSSGTEPEIKFYYDIRDNSVEDANAKSEAPGVAVMAMVDKIV